MSTTIIKNPVTRALALGISLSLGCYVTSLGHRSPLPAVWLISIALGFAVAVRLLESLWGSRSSVAHCFIFGIAFFVLSLTQLGHGADRTGPARAVLESAVFGGLMGLAGRLLVFRPSSETREIERDSPNRRTRKYEKRGR